MPIIEAVGVDTSMTRTAFAWHDSDGVEAVRSLARPQAGDLYSAWMIGAVRGQTKVLTRAWVPLRVIATERLAGMRGAAEKNVALQWAVIEGALRELAEATSAFDEVGGLRLHIALPTPAQLKKFVTGRGDSEKAGMGRFIERHWPNAPDQEDEAEAYALMQFARCRRAFLLGEIGRGEDEHPGWTAYQVDTACKDLVSDAKAGRIEHIDVTGHQALQIAADFRDRAWGPERRVDPPTLLEAATGP